MLEFRECSTNNTKNPKQLVILLHGYGSNKDDLMSIVPEISKYLPNAHFISPSACQPFEKTKGNGESYQWFSLSDRSYSAMLNGVNTAITRLEPFILEQMKRFNITTKQTVILGFSQGGMVALHMGLRSIKNNPRVVLCYSGFLIEDKDSDIALFNTSKIQDIVLVHGKYDDVIPVKSMQRSAFFLAGSGARLHVLTCRALGHGIDTEGLEFGGKILKSIFYV